MKKFFFALMCAIVLVGCSAGSQDPRNKSLEECDNTTYRCWELVTTYMGYSSSSYIWATEYIVVASIQTAYAYVPSGTKYTYKPNAAKDAESCEAQNPEE